MPRRSRLFHLALWSGIGYAIAVTTLTAALVLHSASEAGEHLPYSRAVLWQGIVYVSWLPAVPLLAWMTRRERDRVGPWWSGLLAHLAAGAPLALAHAAFASAVDRHFGVDRSFADAFVARLPVDFLILWALTGVAYAAAYYERYARQRESARTLEGQLARAQLQALKSRLQPHFLFNALNALTVLIRKDPEAAVDMTRHLSDLLRATLVREQAQWVPLREELDVLKAYLAIEQVRFGDRLRVEFDIAPDTLDQPVPDLVLQPLVENAFKHGFADKRGVGTLRLRSRRAGGILWLEVEDDGTGLRAGAPEGIGLSTTRERLAALYGGRATFSLDARPEGGTLARLSLPELPA